MVLVTTVTPLSSPLPPLGAPQVVQRVGGHEGQNPRVLSHSADEWQGEGAHVNTHTRTHARTRLYTYTHAHTHTHARLYTYTHTHEHAHT